MKSVFVEGQDRGIQRMFLHRGWEVTYNAEEADLICFSGGEDVNPARYGESLHPYTSFNPHRDSVCLALWHLALDKSIPCVGICRGGQFLNVINGGKMLQHVTNHTHYHNAIIDGDEVLVSSTHHQMMVPGENAIIIGVGTDAENTKIDIWDEESGQFLTEKNPGMDIEVLVYQNSLCFQPHPEYAYAHNELIPMQDKFFELIEKYCFRAA